MNILSLLEEKNEDANKKNLKHIVENAEQLEGKPLNKWNTKTFLMYFNLLKDTKFNKSFQKDYSQRTMGMFKNIIAKSRDNETCKRLIDNVILNWEALKENNPKKYYTDLPELNVILFNISHLLDEIKDGRYTISRSHRISILGQSDFNTEW